MMKKRTWSQVMTRITILMMEKIITKLTTMTPMMTAKMIMSKRLLMTIMVWKIQHRMTILVTMTTATTVMKKFQIRI